MTLRTTGFVQTRAMLKNIAPVAQDEFDKANRENAEAIVDLAKVLVRKRTGRARALITTTTMAGGGQLLNFGPLSKILEGGTGQRTTKSGANRGSAPAFPFVAPALKATRSKRNARNKKAVRMALKRAGG